MFKFDLALVLGWPDPDVMASRIPLTTFYDWMDYAKRKPFGEERADLRAGIMTSSLINIQLAKGQRRTRPIDFMPLCKPDKRDSHDVEQAVKMRMDLQGVVALHKKYSARIAAVNANRS